MANFTTSDEIQSLVGLQQSNDEELALAASLELAKRIKWSSTIPPILKNSINENYYKNEHSYYVCSYGGSGSKMLQAYLSHFGNTFHIHSRDPPQKLTRVGTRDYPEWFNNIEVVPTLDRQLPLEQIKNTKVIFIYRDPVYAIHSRFIPGKTHRISTDHLNHISATHWNIESVVGNMMDLWKIEEFFDNYTIKDPERNYTIYCVHYDRLWDNMSLFNKTLGLPDIPALYPKKVETRYDIVHETPLREIYKSLLNKIDSFPPVFEV